MSAVARLGAGQIQNYAHRIPNEEAEAAPATAHMFIINPLWAGMDNLFLLTPTPRIASPRWRIWRARWVKTAGLVDEGQG